MPGFVSQFSAVPEPSTWAMMLSGFGLIGSLLRRSKRSVTVRFA
nr:PEPxxWA-CTERM sorting domain-containing protein [Sphingobium subterraneum]